MISEVGGSRSLSTDQRGCGERAEGGLYLSIPASPSGRPIEDFLLDPVVPWGHKGSLRSPMLLPQAEDDEVLDVYLGVGKTSYPFIPDYVEEARHIGISKRLPRNFDSSPLTPGLSRLVLMHPRGIPLETFMVEECCRNGHDGEYSGCVYSLWSLSGLTNVEGVHNVVDDGDVLSVTTPSVAYDVAPPLRPEAPYDMRYAPGLFTVFPLSHFEYVTKDGSIPSEMIDRFEDAGWRLEAVDR